MLIIIILIGLLIVISPYLIVKVLWYCLFNESIDKILEEIE